MDNKNFSDCFSVDEIHKLREMQDEKYEGVSDYVRIKDYHQIAQKVLEIIHQIQISKLSNC
jgi:hypothetical protein